MQTVIRNRSASGQFTPGSSGNPGGRPRDDQKAAKLARSYSVEAIDTLVDIMRNGKDERVRGTEATALLDRGCGKPKVEVAVEGKSYIAALKEISNRMANEESRT